jgi:hypothetical protein
MTGAPRATTVLAACGILAACGSSLRLVPTGPHPPTATPPIVVESEPPPAKVEMVFPDPGKPCAWLDGRWEWVDQGWQWVPGEWVVPPAGCYFATPEALWVPATGRGLLFYLPGRWYRESGTASCGDPRPCAPAAIDTH